MLVKCLVFPGKVILEAGIPQGACWGREARSSAGPAVGRISTWREREAWAGSALTLQAVGTVGGCFAERAFV